MARLPEEQRLAIALVLVEGLSYKDAAEALGIPMGTLTSRLGAGARHCRRCWAATGDDGEVIRRDADGLRRWRAGSRCARGDRGRHGARSRIARAVERHRAAAAQIRGAYDGVLAEPVPDRLAALVAQPIAAPIVGLAERRDVRRAILDRLHLPAWAAMAASLAVGLFIGMLVSREPAAPYASVDGALVARGNLWTWHWTHSLRRRSRCVWRSHRLQLQGSRR